MSAALAGRAALVTGASQGIGRAVAVALAAVGARVALNHHHRPDDAEAAAAEIKAAGGEAFAVDADVRDEAQVKAMFAATIPKLGGLDILVNNAGVQLVRGLLETTLAEYDHVIDTNVRGTFLVGREGIRHMVDRGGAGCVINVASDLGYLGREEFSIYAASKAAIIGLTRSWALEFAPGILVNAIAPGPIDTALLGADNMPPAWREKEKDIPLARFGEPEEVASVAVFLAGPGARFLTGQTIGPNGGSVMP